MSTAAPDWVDAGDSRDHRADAQQAFTAAFDTEPEGIWSAPGRVNLIGEHLDYNGGPVLPLAIDHRTLVAASPRSDGRIRMASRQDAATWEGSLAELRPGRPTGWCGYAAGVLWAAREAGRPLSGLNLLVDGRVPVGGGLSSSAALTCAVALAAAQLSGSGVSGDDARRELAAICVRAENDFAGAPTGGMDQAVVLRALAGHALLLDCTTFDAEQVPVPHVGELLVVDTRGHHELTDGQYGGRRAACERAAQELDVPRLAGLDVTQLPGLLPRLSDDELRGVVRHVVTEVQRVGAVVSHLREGRLLEAGPTLLESHASMRDDFVISTPELDLVVEAAVAAGAPGARMTGGGFGGSAVVLCRPGDRPAVAAAITGAFAAAGFATPGMLPVQASGAAARMA
ncbi:MAG: galactokinase [Ornithinimicrobium sp.]|uniref:galactokinase n=1 Tax=Ornithinimicrobium sp. TaxID=1977084 RepID=UPI003D9B4B35